MRYLFLILVSFNCFAGGFAPVGKDGFNEKTYPKFHEFKHECEEIEGVECFDIAACPLDECELITEITQDDLGINVETKVLKNSEAKKAQRQAEKQAEKELELSNKAAKKALKQSIKADIKDANTVAKLRALVEKLIEAQNE